MKKLQITVAVVLSLLSVACGALGVMGPLDKPKFAGFEWTKMVVRYHQESPRYGRSMTVTIEGSELQSGIDLMKIRKISPMNFPSQEYIQLASKGHGSWDMMISGERGFRISSRENNYRSYIVEMEDEKFYRWLVEICVSDLKRRGIPASANDVALY